MDQLPANNDLRKRQAPLEAFVEQTLRVRRLWRWCRSLAEPVETPDVLRMYATAPRRARQILVVEQPHVEGGV